jgi:hypothetical protein
MPAIRFRLRTLILITLLCGFGLGWWFRPFVLEDRWPNGKLKSQLHVRRGFSGKLLTNGLQRWWWSNGQLAREGTSAGEVLAGRAAYVAMPLQADRAFDRDGHPLDTDASNGAVMLALLWLGMHTDTDARWSNPDDAFAETPHNP